MAQNLDVLNADEIDGGGIAAIVCGTRLARSGVGEVQIQDVETVERLPAAGGERDFLPAWLQTRSPQRDLVQRRDHRPLGPWLGKVRTNADANRRSRPSCPRKSDTRSRSFDPDDVSPVLALETSVPKLPPVYPSKPGLPISSRNVDPGRTAAPSPRRCPRSTQPGDGVRRNRKKTGAIARSGVRAEARSPSCSSRASRRRVDYRPAAEPNFVIRGRYSYMKRGSLKNPIGSMSSR
jgi:hypothetical protein